MERAIIRKIQYEDIYEILKIRNTQFVREKCWDIKNIKKSDQKKWFTDISTDENAHEFMIVVDDKIIGACSLHTRMEHKNAEFGIYIDESFVGVGHGLEALNQLFEYGWSKLNLHKIWGVVFEFNVGAINFYSKNGFYYEGKLKEHVFRFGKYHDVYIISKFNPNGK